MVRYLGVLLVAACTTRSGGPFDSPWSFTIERSTIATTQPNGDAWDPDLSPPDPYVVVYINTTQLDRTGEVQDTFDPDWAFTTASRLMSPGDTIEFEMQDSDTFTNDIVMRCDLTATADAEGPHSCVNSGTTLDFSVNF